MAATAAPGQRSLLVRALYFVLVGWWLTGLWLGLAWVLVVTVVGIPFGVWMISRTPLVLTLKRRDDEAWGTPPRPQHGLLLRAVYFLLVGWWASGLWTGLAYVFCLSVVGLPLGVWMLNQLPYVVSLYRY